MIIILSTADMIKLSGCWYYHQKRRCHPAFRLPSLPCWMANCSKSLAASKRK